MHVLVMKAELHLPHSQSLKAKRSVIKSAVRTLDGWHNVGAAEVGALDKWQRSEVGITVVSGESAHAEELADKVERHLWSLAEAEVVHISRTWWENPHE